MPQSKDAAERADALHEEAMQKSEQGDDDAALSLYLQALALDRNRPNTLYNIALAYKYRRDWEKSLRYNLQAVELRADHEATNWNTGIAATALRQWRVAREAWNRVGMELEVSDQPIDGRFGYACARLNGFEDTDDAVEVVWVSRLSPVTARVNNIPTPAARFRYGDVVLHDGAPTGTRLDEQGREVPVFNVFELFEPSEFATFDVEIDAPDQAAVDDLNAACEQAGMPFEDWTTMRPLCKACSEGRAHEQHDHAPPEQGWLVRRRVGLASKDPDKVTEVLGQWVAGGEERRVEYIES